MRRFGGASNVEPVRSIYPGAWEDYLKDPLNASGDHDGTAHVLKHHQSSPGRRTAGLSRRVRDRAEAERACNDVEALVLELKCLGVAESQVRPMAELLRTLSSDREQLGLSSMLVSSITLGIERHVAPCKKALSRLLVRRPRAQARSSRSTSRISSSPRGVCIH